MLLTAFFSIIFLTKCLHVPGVISFHISCWITFISPIICTWDKWNASFSIAGMNQYMRNVCIGSSINTDIFFCIYFTSFIIWIQFFALTTCLIIFNEADAMIWKFWYIQIYEIYFFKSIIYNFFFGYCYLSASSTTTRNKILIWKTFGLWINISTVDRLCCMTCSLIFAGTIWIQFINVIISFPSLLNGS